MKCHSKWCVIIWHVSEVHLEELRGNGAKKCLKQSPSAAKCLFTSFSQRHQRGGEKNDLLALWRGINRPNTRHSYKTHTSSECTEFNSVEEHFLFHCQSDEKVALPEKIKMARGTDVSLVRSLSISPVDAAHTPLGHTRTSGRNCQRDWYSTQSNKKWISPPWCKHKWPEPWCICLDPLWSSHICVFLTLRLMCFLSSVHTVWAKSIIANSPVDCTDSVSVWGKTSTLKWLTR